MDRPTRGPQKPNDPGASAADHGAPHPAAMPDPWAEALKALQSAAPPSPAHPPSPAAPGVSAPPVRIDEAMEALQVLASRTRAAHGPAADPDDGEDSAFARHGARMPPRPAAFDPRASASEPDWEDDSKAPARRWSRWGSPVLIIVSAAVLAVLLVGALSLSRQWFHGEPAQPLPPTLDAPATAGALAPVVVRMPSADGRADLPTIEKAMSDCDEEAARQQDGLYFLILPLLSPVKNYQPWVAASVGEIGTSVILLRSKDALDGLRDGSLTLYRGAYTFSIIDATTDAPQTWTPATGVAKFAKADAAQIAGFRVRFGFADFVGDTPSNFRFPRQRGVCYWVSALLRE